MPFAVLWECDFCPEQFLSRRECSDHEEGCEKRLAVSSTLAYEQGKRA